MANGGNLTYNFFDLPAQFLNEIANTAIVAVPKIVTALLIIVLGWLIAKISEKIVYKLLYAAQIDKWVEKAKLKEPLYNIPIDVTASLIVKYYILIVFLKEAATKATLTFLADLFDGILQAVPSIILGVAIILIAMIFGNFIKKRVKKTKLPFKDVLSDVIHGVIVFFGLVMALPRLGLTNTQLIEDTFRYIVLGISVGVSLAIGIGFGWAIKEGPAKGFFSKKKNQ